MAGTTSAGFSGPPPTSTRRLRFGCSARRSCGGQTATWGCTVRRRRCPTNLVCRTSRCWAPCVAARYHRPSSTTRPCSPCCPGGTPTIRTCSRTSSTWRVSRSATVDRLAASVPSSWPGLTIGIPIAGRSAARRQGGLPVTAARPTFLLSVAVTSTRLGLQHRRIAHRGRRQLSLLAYALRLVMSLV
jgi:hypothetical protein